MVRLVRVKEDALDERGIGVETEQMVEDMLFVREMEERLGKPVTLPWM